MTRWHETHYTPKTFRNRETSFGLGLVGWILFMLGVRISNLPDLERGFRGVMLGLVAVAIVVVGYRGASMKVTIDSDCVCVRNLLRSHAVRWEQIENFVVEQANILARRSYLMLNDGRKLSMTSIHDLWLHRRSRPSAAEQVAELNDTLLERRAKGAT